MRKILFLFLLSFISCATQKTNTNTMKEVLQPYHFKTRFVELQDGEIAYTKEGSGKKTIIFIHGLSSNGDAWYRNIENLKDDFTCYAIDLPGYGKSFLKAENYSPTYFAEIVNEFARKMKVEKFTLVGHSMGGQTALKFASKYPEKLEKLILVAPAGIEEFTEFEGNSMKMVTTKAAIMNTSDEQIDKNYAVNFHKMPHEASRMIADRKAIKTAADFETHAEAIVGSVHGMLDDKVLGDLDRIKTPTLFLFAKNDFLIPNRYLHAGMTVEDVTKKAENSVKGSQVEIINEAGHFLMFEKPKEVNEAIRRFLK